MIHPAPAINTVSTLLLPPYSTQPLDNGFTLYSLQGGSEPVLKLELVFRAGATTEHKIGVAECMAGLLSEGTKTLASADFAERMESYGATMQTRGGVDTVRVRLYTLTRYFGELISLIKDVLLEPAFDAREFEVYINNKLERLQIDLKKNEILAYRHLTEAIYGNGHPYGRNTFPADYLNITTDDLRQHHAQFILPKNAMIFLSGSFGQKEIDLIRETLGSWNPPHLNGSPIREIDGTQGFIGYKEIDGPQTHQAAIRLGRKLFTPHHPDFNGLFVLNTILGGYFGSRLMNEVRENQGLTYGIYSGMDSFAEEGCFYISTETTTEQVGKVLDAVRAEATKLQTEPIDAEELQMAKNYLMGHMMTQIDGPIAIMDYIKTLKIERLEDSSFAELVETIQGITPGRLMELANVYLDLDSWATIVVR
jgi:zinc protease